MRMPYITRIIFYLMIILVFCTFHIPITILLAESSQSQKSQPPQIKPLEFH